MCIRDRTKSLGGVIINLNNASNFSAFAFILISIPVKKTGCFSKFSQNQKKDLAIRIEVPSFTSLKVQGVTQVKKSLIRLLKEAIDL